MAQAAKASSARSSELRWLSLLSNKDGYGTAVPIIMGQIGAPHRSNRERIANNGSSRRQGSAQWAARYANRSQLECRSRCWSGAQYAAGGCLRSLSEDKKFPLAHVR